MSAGCGAPSVQHGEVTVLENGGKSVTQCHEGYEHTFGDLVRMCNLTSGRWNGDPPLCHPAPGLSSIKIMLLIAGPILLFFAVCLPIDYYFYTKRKQELREQQGMVYHRELRRVGMVRASVAGTLDDLDSPPRGALGTMRRHITRFKSLISILSLKRRIAGRGVEAEPIPEELENESVRKIHSDPGAQDVVAEMESESSSVNTVGDIRPILSGVTEAKNDTQGRREPIDAQILLAQGKLPPITRVNPAKNKRQMYASSRPSDLALISHQSEYTSLPIGQSVHV